MSPQEQAADMYIYIERDVDIDIDIDRKIDNMEARKASLQESP